jgi:hypothetical protein
MVYVPAMLAKDVSLALADHGGGSAVTRSCR